MAEAAHRLSMLTSSHDSPGKPAQGEPLHPAALLFASFCFLSPWNVKISDWVVPVSLPRDSIPKHILVNSYKPRNMSLNFIHWRAKIDLLEGSFPFCSLSFVIFWFWLLRQLGVVKYKRADSRDTRFNRTCRRARCAFHAEVA